MDKTTTCYSGHDHVTCAHTTARQRGYIPMPSIRCRAAGVFEVVNKSTGLRLSPQCGPDLYCRNHIEGAIRRYNGGVKAVRVGAATNETSP